MQAIKASGRPIDSSGVSQSYKQLTTLGEPRLVGWTGHNTPVSVTVSLQAVSKKPFKLRFQVLALSKD
jgi:hypothetical protein